MMLRPSRLPCSRLVRLASLLLALAILALQTVVSIADASPDNAGPAYTATGTALVDAARPPFFLVGASYQGPADRAWKMWADDQFDATLIRQDFARARNAGLGVLRISVQPPLAADLP